MTTRAGRAATAMLGALVAVLTSAGPAQARPTPAIPPDVSAMFAGAALRQAPPGVDADFSGAVADDIHEVFRFSADVVDGIPTREPVTSAGQWLGALTRDGRVLGTVAVSKPQGGPAVPNGFAEDVAVGTALGTLSAAEILIVDEPNGAYYAMAGTTVRPLNDWARKALPEPADITQLQDVVAAQYAFKRSHPADQPGPPYLLISLTSLAAACAVAGTVHLRRRNRRGRLAP